MHFLDRYRPRTALSWQVEVNREMVDTLNRDGERESWPIIAEVEADIGTTRSNRVHTVQVVTRWVSVQPLLAAAVSVQ